jgi:amidase
MMVRTLAHAALPLILVAAASAGLAQDSASANSAAAAQTHIERIRTIDDSGPMLNAVIVYDQQAAAKAAAANGTLLAGRTVLVKDNVETIEWPTTAGSLALKDNVTFRDAPLIANLRKGGGVVLGKTNLSEWANIRSSDSTSGWSAVGGLTKNPHAIDRNACGSSSGSGAAIAAGLAWGAIGTETNGSITCPASINGIVGFKPSVGIVSRTHVVPISSTQDTAGPMTRTVYDAALLLTAIAGEDAADPVTLGAERVPDYTAGLAEYSLQGVRIGVLRKAVGARADLSALFETALSDLARAGAVLVDLDYETPGNFWRSTTPVLMYELRVEMGKYLSTLPGEGRPRSLADLVEFNRANSGEEMRWFGQDLFERALETTDEAAYRENLATIGRMTREEGIDKLLAEGNLEFLVAPTMGPAWASDLVLGDNFSGRTGAGYLAAIAGYPHLTVPMGAIEGLPIGLSFMGARWKDHAVLKAGAAYEKARTAKLPAPSFDHWSPASQ